MTGFGTSSFGLGPFGIADPSSLATQQGQLTSSRSILASGVPEQVADDTGAFAGMSDTLQRAQIALAYELQNLPETIDLTYQPIVEGKIRKCLEFLTDVAPPLLKIESFDFSDNGGSGVVCRVKVRDLLDAGKAKVLPVKRT
ncbi:MAG: hypothetical protein HOW73_47505 [Polyangiaceae bacterium]|nr:hypothetical protein [Polyangiaceae bacterium]